jgi:hypothetical protein
LLNKGFAYYDNSLTSQLNDTFIKAQEMGRSTFNGIWLHITDIASYFEYLREQSLRPKFKQQNPLDVKIKVTHYNEVYFGKFYINIINETLSQINTVISKIDSPPNILAPVAVGRRCLVNDGDKKVYERTEVVHVIGDCYELKCIDSGRMTTLKVQNLYEIDSRISLQDGQAISCELAFLDYSRAHYRSDKAALTTTIDLMESENNEHILDAQVFYTCESWGKIRAGIVVYRVKGDLGSTYHSDLLGSGYAQLIDKELPDSLQTLKNIEQAAKEKRLGVWMKEN